MTPYELLSKLRRDVQAIIDFSNEVELLPESTLNWKERGEKWSILECLEHLNRYSSHYHSELRKAIAVAIPSDNKQEARSTWMGKKFIAMMHPDNTRKQKTLARMNPIHGTLKRDVIKKFLRNQEDLLDIINDASNVDLNKGSVRVEFLKLLRMNIGDTLQFLVVHEQRHIKQALGARLNAETLLAPALKI